MAYLLNPLMAKCGCCGKQAMTMCMGLGCNAVGVMGCRIIDSPAERLSAILTNAMIPCNGRFPTLIVLGSMFFSDGGAAMAVAACVALGAVTAAAVSGVLNRKVFRTSYASAPAELPPLRCPRLGQLLVHALVDKTLLTAGRALVMAAPAGALLWALSESSALGVAADILQPVGAALGMNGLVLTAFILSLPANELLIPVILMGLTGSSLSAAGSVGSELLLQSITWQTAVCMMVFTVFHWPCSTTLITVYRETDSVKKTAAAFALPTVVGCILCLGLNLVL
jgi:ferrous iron transport protein B